MSDTKTFADFGVDPEISTALAQAGITTPFPIQELTLPLALSGADVIGQARTGTGKTLAFGIPLLQRVNPESPVPQGLVIVPTRELCLQVRGDLAEAGATRGVPVVAVYGGKAIDPQSEAIAKGAPVVVGTPGRLLDLMRRRVLDLSGVTTLVLDEADEMLDMGFLPDVEQLIQACASERQTMLFSATMPSEVVALARRYLHKPTFMRADVEEARIAPETRQYFLACHQLDKPAVVARILQTPQRGLCVIFTRTKRMADLLVKDLAGHGVEAAAIHSDLRQEARERTMERFRRADVDVLCATEVAARGLDITDVTHVINYDCPDDEKMYLHRIGRTGRAGAGGVAVTLAVWNEMARLEMIKKALDVDAPTHEVFSTSPLLDEVFDLPPRDGRAPTVVRPQKAKPRRQRQAGGRRRVRRRARDQAEAAPEPEIKATPEAEAAPEPASAAEPEAEPAQAEPARATSRSRGRRRSRTGRDEARRPARSRRGRQDERRQPTPEPAAERPAHPRGTGKPALHRPMIVTHLP